MVYEYHKGTTTWLMRGFSWDPDTKCVTADKDVWDEYIKIHSRAGQFRTKSFPYFESLSMVWVRTVTTQNPFLRPTSVHSPFLYTTKRVFLTSKFTPFPPISA
ncbi:hypothetical protein K1719_034265 [Acacia pycnantha]|nr:hypothetical protein K1719_034265 [Acacia pycnantha]